MTFRTPLHRRMRQADSLRQRYRTDPAYRLHKVNSARAQKGNPPLSHTDEIGRDAPLARERGERGRFA